MELPLLFFVGTPAAAPIGALSVASDVTPASAGAPSFVSDDTNLKPLMLPFLAHLLKLELLLIWVSPADALVAAILRPACGASCWWGGVVAFKFIFTTLSLIVYASVVSLLADGWGCGTGLFPGQDFERCSVAPQDKQKG